MQVGRYFFGPVGKRERVDAAIEVDGYVERDAVAEQPRGVFMGFWRGQREQAGGAVVGGAEMHGRVFAGEGFEGEGEVRI